MAQNVKQLSIFLENKAGSLNEIFELLSGANIRIIASTLSDTTEYGILRIITDDNEAAHAMLKEHRKNSVIRDVVALECDSTSGALYDILNKITSDNLSIEYMYCFAAGQKSVVVLRLNDGDAALKSIDSHGLTSLSDDDLKMM